MKQLHHNFKPIAHGIGILLLLSFCLLVSFIIFLCTPPYMPTYPADRLSLMDEIDFAEPFRDTHPEAFSSAYAWLNPSEQLYLVIDTNTSNKLQPTIAEIIPLFEAQHRLFFSLSTLSVAEKPVRYFNWDIGDPVWFRYSGGSSLQTMGPQFDLVCGYTSACYLDVPLTEEPPDDYLVWHVQEAWLPQIEFISAVDVHYNFYFDFVLNEDSKVVQIIFDGVTYEGEDGFIAFYAALDEAHSRHPLRTDPLPAGFIPDHSNA